ncbi:MAG: transposase, partial [Mediterranea sp.]|nr:transposase [Mediterranea sp.]
MEKKYKSMTIFAFQEQFKDDMDCLGYLSELKWKRGFVCGKCGHTHYCKGHEMPYSRQCTKCRHVES